MESLNVIISKEEYDRLLTAERRYTTLRDNPQGPWYFPYQNKMTSFNHQESRNWSNSNSRSWYMAIAGGEDLDKAIDDFNSKNPK